MASLQFYTHQFASIIWNDLCQNAGYPPSPEPEPTFPPTPLPPFKQEDEVTCSVAMDVAVLVDSRLLSDMYQKEKVVAYLKEVVLSLDIGVCWL